jgi:hypothetical protein
LALMRWLKESGPLVNLVLGWILSAGMFRVLYICIRKKFWKRCFRKRFQNIVRVANFSAVWVLENFGFQNRCMVLNFSSDWRFRILLRMVGSLEDGVLVDGVFARWWEDGVLRRVGFSELLDYGDFCCGAEITIIYTTSSRRIYHLLS